MDNFKDFYLSTYKLPTLISEPSFRPLPFGEIETTLHLFGEDTYCTVRMSCQISLEHYQSIEEPTIVNYVVDSPARNIPQIHSYRRQSDKRFISIIKEDGEYLGLQVLTTQNRWNITLGDFITSMENEFLDLINTQLDSKFKTIDNGGYVGFEVQDDKSLTPHETTVNITKTFKRAFNKLRKLTNLDSNNNMASSIFSEKNIKQLNNIISYNELSHLKHTLQKDLLEHCVIDRKLKI